MFQRNYMRIFTDIIVSDYARLAPEYRRTIGQEIWTGNRDDFSLISYDFLSIAMQDGYDDVKDYLEVDASDDLKYYLRKLAFTLGRELHEEYQEKTSLKQIMLASLKAGIASLDDLISDEDRENKRFMDPDTDEIGVSVMLLALLVETLTLDVEQFDEPKKPKGPNPA